MYLCLYVYLRVFIQAKLSKYRDCWWHSLLCSQTISKHVIVWVWYVNPCFPSERILTIGTIPVLRSDPEHNTFTGLFRNNTAFQTLEICWIVLLWCMWYIVFDLLGGSTVKRQIKTFSNILSTVVVPLVIFLFLQNLQILGGCFNKHGEPPKRVFLRL